MDSPNINTDIIVVNNCFLEQPTECKFTHKLDEKVIPDYKYVIYFANDPAKDGSDEHQFCCFMNLTFKSLENDVYTFEGSITYEMCYHTNVFDMQLVWNKTNNTYYLNDLLHNLNQVNYVEDRESDFLLISGSDIVRHFFKNPPTFLPTNTF